MTGGKNRRPYRLRERKRRRQPLLDWAVPIGLFALYFFVYSAGEVDPEGMMKTTGLVALALLSVTLLAGPVGRFFPRLGFIQAHRKFWGIASFFFVLVHVALAFWYDFKVTLPAIFPLDSPERLGLFAGIAAFTLLFAVALSSAKRIIRAMDPRVWKSVQLVSYLALLFAVIHGYLMEQGSGLLGTKRTIEQTTYAVAVVALIMKVLVLLSPKSTGSPGS